VQYILFAVTMEIVRTHVSDVSQVTPPTKNYTVRDKVDLVYIWTKDLSGMI